MQQETSLWYFCSAAGLLRLLNLKVQMRFLKVGEQLVMNASPWIVWFTTSTERKYTLYLAALCCKRHVGLELLSSLCFYTSLKIFKDIFKDIESKACCFFEGMLITRCSSEFETKIVCDLYCQTSQNELQWKTLIFAIGYT